MSSVTDRIKQVRQPRGGYIKPSQFSDKILNDGCVLHNTENVHPTVTGMAVDYLTRFMTGSAVQEAFSISLLGVKQAALMKGPGVIEEAGELLKGITGTDNLSITNACKMATFDVWYRNPMAAMMSMPKTADDTNPDAGTIENIRVMVQRGITFFKEYGPVTKNGFTFGEKGYTATVDTGDGDFLTKDTLWDFKVSKNKPDNKHTLQLLMYWIMGQHSEKPEFKGITKLGIFNPRLNTVYTLDMAKVPRDIIRTVERDVICY